MIPRRLLTGAGVFVLYLALVVVLTWPLGARLTTHLPDTRWICGFDLLYTAWVLAWESHALVTGVPLADANIYHPARETLFYSNTSFGALPFFMPTFLASGNPTLALNVLLLVAVALTAAALHLVALRWTGSHGTAFIAGWTCLMTPWTLWLFTPTAPNEGVLPYLPFIVLLAAEARPRLGRLTILAVLQSLTDAAYIAAATVGPLVLLAALRLVRRGSRAAGGRLLAVVALTALALLPIHLKHLTVRAAMSDLAGQSLWTPLTVALLPVPWAENQPSGVPLVVFALIVVALLLRARTRATPLPGWGPAAFWAVTGFLLTVPPNVAVFSRTVSLPNALLARWTPIYQIVREPSRLGVASLVGLALLGAVACAECGRRLPTRYRHLFVLLVAVVMFAQYAWDGTRLPGRYPVVEAPDDPESILSVLRSPGGPLLEIPIARPFESGATGQARAIFRSTRHWRPLLNGYGSYFPLGFQDRMNVVLRLPDPTAVTALRAQTGLALVLVHLDEFGIGVRSFCRHLPHGVGRSICSADPWRSERASWEAAAAAARPDLRLVTRSEHELLFAVEP